MALVKREQKDLYDPWTSLKSLQDEINELFAFDRFPSAAGLFDRSFSPAIDVVEGDREFTVVCELPNIDQNDIDVSIASNVLTIKGQKTEVHEDSKKKYYRKESWTGSFQRTLPLPGSIAADRISAGMKDGILTITIPKKEEAIPKQISVEVK